MDKERAISIWKKTMNKTSSKQTKKKTNKQTKNVFDHFSYQDIHENINQAFRKIIYRAIFT